MLVVIVLALICVRLRACIEASWTNGRGSASLSIGALGVYLRREYAISVQAFTIRIQPCRADEKKKESSDRARRLQFWLLKALYFGRGEQAELYLRLGLGDAFETAVASGAVHALAGALFAAAGERRLCRVHVTPDFDTSSLCAHLRGIFSWKLGDIMLAALKQAFRKRARD